MERRDRDHKRRSREEFDRQAGSYDTAGFGRHARRLEPAVLAAVDAIPFTALLDVGCGTGRLLAAIAEGHPGARLLGIDISPEMIAVAGERLGGAAAPEGVRPLRGGVRPPAGSAAGQFAWRGWRYRWRAEPGDYELSCRATDAGGDVQPLEQPWNYQGMGNNLVQTVPVTVRRR